MQTAHILQLSNNHTITFEKQGGQILVRVKNGDQPLANAASEIDDMERMFELIIGDTHSKPGPGPTATKQQMGTQPSKAATEASKK